MAGLFLPPFAIRYTQDSIRNRFRGSDGRFIGHVLDDLYDGILKVADFPPIKVFLYPPFDVFLYPTSEVFSLPPRSFWSADNRRLWVFKELQNLGKCDSIPVKLIPFKCFDRKKFTTKNHGLRVKVRGDLGSWYKQQYDLELRTFRTQTRVRTQATRIYRHYIIVPEDECDEDDESDTDDEDDGRRHRGWQQVWSVARLVGRSVLWLLFSLFCLVVLMVIMIVGIENNRR